MHLGWKRLLALLLGLGVLAFLITRGSESPEAIDETAPEFEQPFEIPLPPAPEPEPPAERAPGTYILDVPDLRVSLELMRDRRFRFLSTRKGAVREGEGTWSLTGNRLTLAYTSLGGQPVGEEPMVVVNVWNEKSIELKDTGIEGRVILTKHTVIRRR